MVASCKLCCSKAQHANSLNVIQKGVKVLFFMESSFVQGASVHDGYQMRVVKLR